MLVLAATRWLFLHATLATFSLGCRTVKINTGLLPHAIMYINPDARNHRHVHHCQYAEEQFFHCFNKNIDYFPVFLLKYQNLILAPLFTIDPMH